MSQAEEQTDDYLVAFEAIEHVVDFTNGQECQESALEKARNRLEDAGLDHIDVRIGRQRCTDDSCPEIHSDLVIGAGRGFVKVVMEGRVYNAEDETHAKEAMKTTLGEIMGNVPHAHVRTKQATDDEGF